MSLGTWFVLEDRFLSEAELPQAGTRVKIQSPNGDNQMAEIADVRISHGTTAIRFNPDLASVPRLSKVKGQE